MAAVASVLVALLLALSWGGGAAPEPAGSPGHASSSSSWDAPEPRHLESTLDDVAGGHLVCRELLRQLRDIAVPRGVAPDAAGHPALELRERLARDRVVLERTSAELAGISLSSLEEDHAKVLRMRLAARRFVNEAADHRRRQYETRTARAAQDRIGLLEETVFARSQLPTSIGERFAVFCDGFPSTLSAVCVRGPTSDDRLGRLLVDIADVLNQYYWLNHADQREPVMVAPLERLIRVLSGAGSASVARARSVALALCAHQRHGVGKPEARNSIQARLPEFRQLALDFPGSRRIIEGLAASIREAVSGRSRPVDLRGAASGRQAPPPTPPR